MAHVRISVADLRRAAMFYGALFGWVIVGETSGELHFLAPDGLRGAFWSSGEPSTAGPEIYIRVASIEDTLKRALELGGARLVRAGPGPRGGRVAQLVDPEGNRVGLWSPG